MRVLEHAPTHLKLFVRRLPDDWPCDRLSRPDWFSVTDSGGWREQGSRKILQAVATKSTKISRYRENVARELHLGGPEEADVRLLVIADHMWNYGQIAPDQDLTGNMHGFNAVYFFPSPEKPLVLKNV